MFRLLRAELYRYPRRMTVWAGLAVLLFIAVVNAPGIFAPFRTEHRLILPQAAVSPREEASDTLLTLKRAFLVSE